MVTWPSTLPVSPLLDGFSETAEEIIIRSKMETGPDKVRARTTAGVRKFSMAFMMTKNETAIFDDFYLNDLNGGAAPFDFTHPRTGETLSMRMVKSPIYNPQNSEYFRIKLDVEALP